MTETTTHTLTDFLLARLAEDEAAAQAAVPEIHWTDVLGLRDCEAKRKIVGIHDSAIRWRSAAGLDGPTSSQATLRALASVYADHPDFNPEWRM